MLHVAQMSDTEWDAALDKTIIWQNHHDFVGAWSPHNYSAWARMKMLDGWKSLRIVNQKNEPVAQALVRQIAGVAVTYCPGGFATSEIPRPEELVRLLRSHLTVRGLYVRVHDITPSIYRGRTLADQGWSSVTRPMSSGLSLLLPLDQHLESRVNRLSPNWRRNLRRGETRGNVGSIVTKPSEDEIAYLYQELETAKHGFVATWERSAAHLKQLIAGLGSRLIVARCTSDSGSIRAIRAAVKTGGCAFDVLAATSAEGRKHYSSHLALWTLMRELSQQGVRHFDLGGVDPLNNRGVYDFKKGTGATAISYGGEFDASFPKFAGQAFGDLLARLAGT